MRYKGRGNRFREEVWSGSRLCRLKWEVIKSKRKRDGEEQDQPEDNISQYIGEGNVIGEGKVKVGW